LSRAISLLRAATPAAKQLKLVESVSLGEKRFVAVVHADGRRFLVGGGASGVSLLAQLEESPKSTENLRSFAGPTELAG
jgi:flagellar biogenesis protein FliO